MHQAAYARRLGVNPSTVNRWIKAGRISLRPDGLIDPVQADRERLATESPLPQHQSLKARWDAQREAKAAAALSPPAPKLDTSEELGLALKLETYKLQKAKAEQANLELDKAAGLLVERSEVEYLLQDLAATLASKLDGMAVQLAPALATHRGDVSAMQSEIESFARDLLEGLSQHLERKVQQHLGN